MTVKSSRDPGELLANISTVPKNLPKMIHYAQIFLLTQLRKITLNLTQLIHFLIQLLSN